MCNCIDKANSPKDLERSYLIYFMVSLAAVQFLNALAAFNRFSLSAQTCGW